MYSKELNEANKLLLESFVKSSQRVKTLVAKKTLHSMLVFAERYLLSRTSEVPVVGKKKRDNLFKFLVKILLGIVFFILWMRVYYLNSYYEKKNKKIIESKKGIKIITFSPERIDYSDITNEFDGLQVIICGPLIKNKKKKGYYTTLLTSKFKTWIKAFYVALDITIITSENLINDINLLQYIAFGYSIMKQNAVSLSAQLEGVIRSESPTLLFSSESIGYALIESLTLDGLKTVQHSHGVFLNENLLMDNIYSRYVIVSSQREKKIIEDKSIVLIGGAPQQALGELKQTTSDKDAYEYDLIIIASFELPFLEKDTFNELKVALNSINRTSLKVLLRHHPTAPAISRESIHEMIPRAEISKSNNSLHQDIEKSRIAICMSVDSLLRCIKSKRKTIFFPIYNGNRSSYISDFAPIGESVLCAKSGIEILEAIDYFRQCPDAKIESDNSDVYSLLGEPNSNKTKIALKWIINQ